MPRTFKIVHPVQCSRSDCARQVAAAEDAAVDAFITRSMPEGMCLVERAVLGFCRASKAAPWVRVIQVTVAPGGASAVPTTVQTYN